MPDAPLDPLPNILDAGTLNLLAGASGVGKTALIAGLAVAFRDHLPVFGHLPNPLPGLGYVTADRRARSSQRWFAAAGCPELAQYSFVDDRARPVASFRNRYGGPHLLKLCVETLRLPPGSLVFVDPIALFLGGNLLDYREVAQACIEIGRWLIDAQYCVVGICHTAKLKTNKQDRYARPQDRIMGTGALLGFTDTQMYLMSPQEAEKDAHVFLWNPHHHPQEEFDLPRDKATGLFVLTADTPAVLLARLDPDLQTLYQLIPTPGGAPCALLVKWLQDTSVNRSTVWRRLKALERLGWARVDQFGVWARNARPAK